MSAQAPAASRTQCVSVVLRLAQPAAVAVKAEDGGAEEAAADGGDGDLPPPDALALAADVDDALGVVGVVGDVDDDDVLGAVDLLDVPIDGPLLADGADGFEFAAPPFDGDGGGGDGGDASEDDVRCQACRGRHVRHTCGKGKHPPPKKPRVRPPRKEVFGPKRPRGRPRKHPLPDAPLAVEGAVEERFRILTEIERATSGEAKLLLGLASAVTPSSSPPPRPRSDSSSSSEPSAAPTTLRTVGLPFKTKAKVAKVGKTVPYRGEVTVIRVPPPPPPTPREMFVAKCLEFSRKVAREFPPGCPAFALYKLAITAQRADHAGRCAVVARLRELFRTDAEVTEMFFDLLSPGLRAEFQVD